MSCTGRGLVSLRFTRVPPIASPAVAESRYRVPRQLDLILNRQNTKPRPPPRSVAFLKNPPILDTTRPSRTSAPCLVVIEITSASARFVLLSATERSRLILGHSVYMSSRTNRVILYVVSRRSSEIIAYAALYAKLLVCPALHNCDRRRFRANILSPYQTTLVDWIAISDPTFLPIGAEQPPIEISDCRLDNAALYFIVVNRNPTDNY